MLKRAMKRAMRKFGQRYDYDVGYMEHFIDVDPAACYKFSKVQPASAYRKGIPAEPWYAAKIRTVLTEDCGPCTQLAVNMALEAGVSPNHIASIVERRFNNLPEETAMVIRFTELTLAHDPAADDYRDRIISRWGEQALVSLALVISTTRVFPTLKYVLGHGKACARVTVGDESVPAIRAEAAGAVA